MDDRSIEYRLKPDDYLCFVRIPKTASTTLVSVLDAQFHVDDICPISVGALVQTPREELARYRLFRAHFDYDLRDYLPRPPIYVTMLRHPVDRLISYYEFCQRFESDAEFDQYQKRAAAGSLKDFVCNPDPTLRIRIANLQTRQIALGLGSRHYDQFTPSPLETQYSDDELLVLAQQHLEEFAVVGITERFQDSLLLLAYVFGWYPVVEVQNLRVASKKTTKDALDPETLDAILQANRLDMALYEYAQQLFERHYRHMLRDLQRQYGVALEPGDRTLPSLLEKHYAKRYAERHLEPLQTLNFNCHQPISGAGWHRRNGPRSGLKGAANPFRWTGPATESTLDFPLATNTDLTIRLRIGNAAMPDILDSFRLLVNDRPIPLETLTRRGKAAALQGQIPQAVLQSDRPFTRLTFCVDRTVSLQEMNPASPDSRVVGLALQMIQVFPTDAKPDTPAYRYFLFPLQDAAWVEAAEFVQQHLQPHEKVAAPIEFSEWFPHCHVLSANAFNRSTTSWVIVHKGWMAEINLQSLKWMVQTGNLVFANSVFVVFTRSPVKAAKFDAGHAKLFWQNWRKMQVAQWTRSPFWRLFKRQK